MFRLTRREESLQRLRLGRWKAPKAAKRPETPRSEQSPPAERFRTSRRTLDVPSEPLLASPSISRISRQRSRSFERLSRWPLQLESFAPNMFDVIDSLESQKMEKSDMWRDQSPISEVCFLLSKRVRLSGAAAFAAGAGGN